MSDDLVKQMNNARDFPANTCGASRHAAMIAEALCRGEDYPMLAEEPDHCGESIAATVAALWECRTKLAQQDDLVQAAVAAKLREAANIARASLDGEIAYDDILDLITTDAQAALDRVVSARFGVVRSEVVRLSAEGKIDSEATERLLAAIRKGGE